MIDMEKLNGILNIVLLSSFLSLTAAFFSLWFLSKWAEIKELIKNLTQKVEQSLTSEIKNEKLTSVYGKKEEEASNIPVVTFAEDTTTNITTTEVTTTKLTTTKLTTTEPTTTEPTTTEVTTTSKPKTLEESSQEIKEIIKKRKSKNENSK